MKRRLGLFLAGILLMSTLMACGKAAETDNQDSGTADSASSKQSTDESSEEGKQYKIGVTMSSRDQFLSTLEKGILGRAEEKDVEIVTFDANNDTQKQLEQINTFISGGFDAMIVNLVDTNNGPDIVKLAGDMPIIFVDRKPDTSILEENKRCYVGAEEYKAGAFQGEWLADFFQDKEDKTINLVILKGILGLENTENRTKGAVETLEEKGFTVVKVFEDTADYDRAKALDKMTTFMGTKKAFDAVVCNNDEMALGALEAMKLAGVDVTKVPVCGIDGTDAAQVELRAGNMAMSAYQDPKEVGESCFDQAYEVVTTGKMAVFKDVPFQTIDKDNIDQIIPKE